MIFFHHTNAGQKNITLENTDFHSLIRVRRKRVQDTIVFIHIETNSSYTTDTDKNYVTYYTYTIEKISKKSAELTLISKEIEEKFIGNIHLFWGICELKTITSTLPFLNQMGVEKITFVQCERSQGNIKLTEKVIEKCKTILRSSCEQCGRNTLMKIENIDFDTYIQDISEKHSENSELNYICDFSGAYFSSKEITNCKKNTSHFFIGPEGGFSEKEKNMFQELAQKKLVKIRKFSTNLILKSETACITTASFFLQ